MNFTVYCVVCPLVFLAGYVDSIAGGGGLISLPAYMLAGLPAHTAIATNKLSSTLGTSVAAIRYAKQGYVPWKLSLFCAAFAFLGSNLGARLSLVLDETILKIVMLAVLPAAAAVVFKSKALVTEREALPVKKTFLLSGAVSLVIGIYDGLYGPGTGTFLLLFLTLASHLKLTEANGVTKIINLSSNAAALTVFLLNRAALMPLGLTAAVFNMAGNFFGSRTFSRKGSKIVKPVMLTVLGVFLVKLIWELCAGT